MGFSGSKVKASISTINICLYQILKKEITQYVLNNNKPVQADDIMSFYIQCCQTELMSNFDIILQSAINLHIKIKIKYSVSFKSLIIVQFNHNEQWIFPSLFIHRNMLYFLINFLKIDSSLD